MTLYKGSQKIGTVYYGGRKISAIYKGSQLLYSADPYKPGVVILDKSAAGTYTFTLKTKRTVQVVMVGAGGGGAWARYAATFGHTENGGSGAMLQGTTTLNAGTYTVVVGKGGTSARQDQPMYASGAKAQATNGTATTFAGMTAGGGNGAYATAGWGAASGTTGAGGTATASTGFTATQGVAGDTTGVFKGHGAGGDGATPSNGKDGYIWIKSV